MVEASVQEVDLAQEVPDYLATPVAVVEVEMVSWVWVVQVTAALDAAWVEVSE